MTKCKICGHYWADGNPCSGCVDQAARLKISIKELKHCQDQDTERKDLFLMLAIEAGILQKIERVRK